MKISQFPRKAISYSTCKHPDVSSRGEVGFEHKPSVVIGQKEARTSGTEGPYFNAGAPSASSTLPSRSYLEKILNSKELKLKIFLDLLYNFHSQLQTSKHHLAKMAQPEAAPQAQVDVSEPSRDEEYFHPLYLFLE
jgi:hypothetical protein